MAGLWPEQEDTLLRQVIADHGSASEAAIMLGAAGYERSRCACIGYARRQTALGKDGYRWQSHRVERPPSQATSKPRAARAAQAKAKPGDSRSEIGSIRRGGEVRVPRGIQRPVRMARGIAGHGMRRTGRTHREGQGLL
jgi:hypothetical protein